MPKFLIVVESTFPRLMSKVIEASSIEEAQSFALDESWTPEDGWKVCDEPDGLCEIRDELCREVE